MSTITTKDGTQIYCKELGMGPVVTFSHGWPLNADAWDGQMLVAMAGSAKSLLGTIWTAMPTILQPGLVRSISKRHARRPSRPLPRTKICKSKLKKKKI